MRRFICLKKPRSFRQERTREYHDDDNDDDYGQEERRRSYREHRGRDYRDEYEEDEDSRGSGRRPRLSARQGGRRDTRKDGTREVYLSRPSSFEESADTARYLLAGRVVVLDLKGTGPDTAQRVVDFICGTVYAMNGEIKSISVGIFIAAPSGVDLTGDFSDITAGMVSQSAAGNMQFTAAGSAAARRVPAMQQQMFRAAV